MNEELANEIIEALTRLYILAERAAGIGCSWRVVAQLEQLQSLVFSASPATLTATLKLVAHRIDRWHAVGEPVLMEFAHDYRNAVHELRSIIRIANAHPASALYRAQSAFKPKIKIRKVAPQDGRCKV